MHAKLFKVLVLAIALSTSTALAHPQKTLLNVSYDPTRERYQDYNAAFVKYRGAFAEKGRHRLL